MRYLIWKPVAVVSRWMSEARRCRALKMVVSTRRTMGASSLSVRRSRSSTSSSRSSSWSTWILRASPASSMTFWPLSDFFSTSWIWASGAPAKRRGRFSCCRRRSWVGMSRGSAMASHRTPSRSCTGHEMVLEHQVDGDRLEERELHRLPGQVQVRIQLPGGPEVDKACIAGLGAVCWLWGIGKSHENILLEGASAWMDGIGPGSQRTHRLASIVDLRGTGTPQ